ncbi:ABC-2 type transporter [Panicum miliaceum]|uniref:ABC-2 type transporter n=1 Tax=Panicum miliaceum TaxID=4540 RepID=A0A3L6PCS1_PANMI|nr:ABC-2 type transporter [Panicum miliaceum]
MAHAAAAADVPTVRPRAAGDGDDGGDGEGEARRLWAELERMPTPQRARSAIVTLEEGEKEGAGRKAVVDVGRLGPGQRRALLDRLVGSADRDNERFLRELRERIDRVGIVLPTIEVRFEHLKADAEVHIGTRGLPTILNSVTSIFEGTGNALRILPSRKQTMPILNGISGIIKPQRREKEANVKPDADLDAFMKAAALGGQEANVVVEYMLKLILLSVIEMTLFFRTEMHRDSVVNGGIYMGALFFTTLMIIFNGFSELTLTILKLPIFFKQRDLLFYPAWTYTVPSWILKIPITFLEVGGFVFITYYAIGFDPDVVRLFKQYLLFLAANQMAASLFRFIAGAARNMIVAYVFGSFAILVVMLLGGFVISRAYGPSYPSVSEETLKEKNANLIGVAVDVSVHKVKGLGSNCQSSESSCQATGSYNETKLASVDANSMPSQRGMVLPFVPLSLTFDSIRYSVDIPQLLLLKQGGEEIYFGPLGHHSSEMIKYFEEIEGVAKIKDGYNPATWMLEVTTVSQEFVLGVDFSDIYKNSELYQRNKSLIHELSTPPPGSSDLHFPTTHSRSFFTQCLACLWKQNLSYWRNLQYNAVRFFFTAIKALLFGTIFWGLGSKRWYYWLCPVAWSLYGMVVSQYGDDVDTPLFDGVSNTTVAKFVSDYFGYKYSFLGVVAVVVGGVRAPLCAAVRSCHNETEFPKEMMKRT